MLSGYQAGKIIAANFEFSLGIFHNLLFLHQAGILPVYL